MFYEPSLGHGLAHDPFKAIVAPRPIGWISTISTSGNANLAPYSFFNAVSASPPMLAFSSEGLKDTVTNARDTGEFVYNLVSLTLLDQMNKTSAALPHGESEFAFAGLAQEKSRIVKPPRVAKAAAALECKVLQVISLTDLQNQETGRFMVIGQVVGVHIDDAFVSNGLFDTVAAQPVARCGYRDYAAVQSVFELRRPDD
jgi:flavin reductase (DIM6/NTAB) family NADH-FMN oxidoreductase RutF